MYKERILQIIADLHWSDKRTRVSGEIRRALGENHAQITTRILEKTDENSGCLVLDPIGVGESRRRRRLRHGHGREHLTSSINDGSIFVGGRGVEGGWRGFVEAELLREVSEAVRFDLCRVGWGGRHGCESIQSKKCSHLVTSYRSVTLFCASCSVFYNFSSQFTCTLYKLLHTWKAFHLFQNMTLVLLY